MFVMWHFCNRLLVFHLVQIVGIYIFSSHLIAGLRTGEAKGPESTKRLFSMFFRYSILYFVWFCLLTLTLIIVPKLDRWNRDFWMESNIEQERRADIRSRVIQKKITETSRLDGADEKRTPKSANESHSSLTVDIAEIDSCHSNSCQICLSEYEVGDTICWSPNDSCVHIFHLKCASDWLISHDGCPCCRSKYLLHSNEEKYNRCTVTNDERNGDPEDTDFLPLQLAYVWLVFVCLAACWLAYVMPEKGLIRPLIFV